MITRTLNALTQTQPQEKVDLLLTPDASFWRALDLVMQQYLDRESRRQNGLATDLYEYSLCTSLQTLDRWR